VYEFNPSYKQLERQQIFKEVGEHELSVNEYKDLFEQEIAQGCRSLFLIGGEPTLRMDIIELAYRFFGRNITLISNGLIKIPSDLKFPFAISVDGGEVVHDMIRGSGTWRRIFDNYSNDHRVQLSCCLRKGTANQIQTIIDGWIDTDIFGASFFFLTPPKGDDSPTVLGEEREYAKTELHRVIDEYPNFVRMTHDLVDLLCDSKRADCPVFRYTKWYDYQGNEINHCLLGINADCRLCGCISPLYLTMLSHQWWKLANRRMIDTLTLPRDSKQCRRRGQK
jgi:MoaA/NifB/PqqE/SkfB family radical SAM enzyme